MVGSHVNENTLYYPVEEYIIKQSFQSTSLNFLLAEVPETAAKKRIVKHEFMANFWVHIYNPIS